MRHWLTAATAQLLRYAEALFKLHGPRSEVLEVVFADEGGSGQGVTTEFYSKVLRASLCRGSAPWG